MFGKRSGTDTDPRAPKPGAVSPEPAPAPAPAVLRAPAAPAIASRLTDAEAKALLKHFNMPFNS